MIQQEILRDPISAERWLSDMYDRAKAFRQRCGLLVLSMSEARSMHNKMLLEVGAILGGVAALRGLNVIGDEVYDTYRRKATALLLPTTTQERISV